MAKVASRAVIRAQLSPDFWVDLREDLSYGERQSLRRAVMANHQQQEWTLIATVLKGWNMEDDDGNVLPIAEESLALMREEDVILMAEAIKKQYVGLTDERKKV